MAFGFQNCCDTEEYFYLNGIPATVSENEVYSISTLEGFDFCATYVELPELYYQPLTYNLDVMVEQTSCDDCTTSNPCPDTIDIVLDENVTISNYNECSVLTELPLEVTCNTPQPAPGATTGYLGITITGGQQPYRVYSANTGTQIAGSAQIGQIIINNQAPPGEYCYDVVDDYNAVVSLCCTVVYSPAPLEVTCSSTKTSVWADTGTVTLDINGGEPPYTTYYNGSAIDLPLQDLSAGSYELTTIDSGGQTITSTCTVTENIPTTTYPEYLCLSFVYCNTRFYLTFTSAGTENYLPYYTLNTPNDIAVSSMILSADTSFHWFTSTETSTTSDLNLAPGCTLLPSPGDSISFSKLISDTSPLGEWISEGIFNSGVHADEGQCVDIPPTFTATGSQVCILDAGATGVAQINAVGGSGGPYTYYVDGVSSYSPYVPNLSIGAHTVQVSDSSSNLSTVGSVTISTQDPQNLIINSCGQLLTSLNSTAGYLNADFSVTPTLNNWPTGTQVTGLLNLQVDYTYEGANNDSNAGVSLLSWLNDVGINNNPITFTIGGTPITINSTNFESPWSQISSTPYYSSTTGLEVDQCVYYQRTQTWQSSPITLSNSSGALQILINTLIQGEQFTQPQTCNGVNLNITFRLRLTNLEVVSGGCVQIDEEEGILMVYQASQIVPQNGYNAPFTGQFLNGTGCAVQLSCNTPFTMSASLGTALAGSTYSLPDNINNDIDGINDPIWYVNYNGGRAFGNGSSSSPKVAIRQNSGQYLTIGQTYYLKFIFTIRPLYNVYVIFENYWLNSIQNPLGGYTFIINPSDITQDVPYYRQVTRLNSNGGSGSIPLTYVYSVDKNNPFDFSMQISSCPWT